MDQLFMGEKGEQMKKAVLAAVVLLAVYLGVLVFGTTLSSYFSTRDSIKYNNTSIDVVGEGEAYSVPDVATFTYSIVSEKKSVADAQAEATAKTNAITAYLQEAGVEVKDIKTTEYNIAPQYDYVQTTCAPGVYCSGKQVLRGYEVRQSTLVKVRDTKKAGDLLSGVGTKGATNVGGLAFAADDPTAVQAEARAKAISDAQAKAKVLARQLGVSIVKMSYYREGGSYDDQGPTPMYAMSAKASAAPEVFVGQNKVTSTVTLTYEVR